MDRKQFNRPLAQTQIIQKKMADMCTDITLGLVSMVQLSHLMDTKEFAP